MVADILTSINLNYSKGYSKWWCCYMSLMFDVTVHIMVTNAMELVH